METDLAKPFSYWKPLDHEMLKFSLNTLFLYFRSTVYSQIYRSITFYRSNIGSALK